MGPYRGTARVPDVLVCAGLDPSGGAGLIADVQVIARLGARPCGIATALTVQNTTGVVGSQALDPELVQHQLEFLLSDIEVKAVKIGMVGSSPIARAISAALDMTAAPVVWDPVLYPSRGDVALADGLFGAAVAALRPHLTLLTPNARELAYLIDRAPDHPIEELAEGIAAGHTLARRLDAAVLVKGGHLSIDGEESVDALVLANGNVERLVGTRIAGGHHVHGTGCALSSAIAALLAQGRDLVEACRAAKALVAERISSPSRPGRGAASVL